MLLGSRLALAFSLCSTLLACGDDTGGGNGGSGGSGGDAAGGAAAGGSDEGGGGAGDGGNGGAAPGTPCEEICGFFADLELEVMCGYEGGSCIGDCEAGFANTVEACHDEAIAYNDCLMTLPAASWNCTDGTFTPIGDDCTAALDALSTCVANN